MPEADYFLVGGTDENTQDIVTVTGTDGSFRVDGAVRGRVVNEKGEPLAGVRVTKKDGRLTTNLTSGRYTVTTTPEASKGEAEAEALLREILEIVEGLKVDMNGLKSDVRKLRGELTGGGAR